MKPEQLKTLQLHNVVIASNRREDGCIEVLFKYPGNLVTLDNEGRLIQLYAEGERP